MQKINKILNIVTIVMFVITVVLLGLFYFGGELPNSQYVTPVYTEQLLWWSYLLFGVAIVAALVFPIARLFTRPKEAMKSFIALAGIIVLVLIAYSMSDGTIMNIPGYSGSDNVPGTLKFTDTILITTYFLGIGATTFREIQFDLNNNNQFDGANDWMAGDWVAWVGTYEDLMEQNDGQCHILLCEDWANNRYSGDTGYTGFVVLSDGTFVMDSYGHWDKEFSQSWQGSDGSGYNVKTDLCYIKQAKFKLADVIGESAIAVKDVTLDLSEVKLTERGQTVQLTATVAPKNATNKQVNFSSDREEVATVDEEGKVTAKADGTAVVTVTTVDGNKTAICSVTVEIPKDPTPDPKPDPTPAPKPSVPDNQESTTGSTMTVGSEQKSGKGIYRITGTRKTVTFVKPMNDKNTSFNVPASVKLADGRYKVTAIDKNAFKNNRKLKKVTIGNKVTKIGAGAFSGAKNLKAITIKSKLLKSVGKNALKGIHKKCAIKVPKTKLTAYKRLLSKKGQKASVKITK